MIKSDYGRVEISGNGALLAAEFASIVMTLYRKEIFKKDMILDLVNEGFKTDEEIRRETKEKYREGITADEFIEMMEELSKARKSGQVTDKDKPKVETIVDDDKFKVKKIEIDGKGKSKEEIAETIKNLLEKGDL